MSSLPALIKFRFWADKLSDNEFEQFTLKLIQQFGRNIITTSIFNAFTKHNNENKQMEIQFDIDDITKIIIQIVEDRKKKHKIKVCKPITNITKLPTDVIGEIGSWLNTEDFCYFCVSNRIIYININSPNTLRSLNFPVDITQNIAHINLSRFGMIQQLDIPRIWEFNKLFEHHSVDRKWKLTKLSLSNIAPKHIDKNVEFEKFIAYLIKSVNYSNVSILELYGWKGGNVDLFTKLLVGFSNLEYLELHEFYDVKPRNHDYTQQLNLNINLKGLSAQFGNGFDNRILELFANRLEALGIHDHTDYNADKLISLKFPNLRKFEVVLPNTAFIEIVMKTAKELTEFYVDCGWDINDKQTIMDIIQQTHSLKLIHLNLNSESKESLEIIINGIESGLLKIKNIKRREFQIVFETFLMWTDDDDDSYKLKWNDIILFTTQIMNVLSSSNVEKFMVSWKIYENESGEAQFITQNIDDLLQQNIDHNKYFVNQFIDTYSRMFIVTNSETMICKVGCGLNHLF